MNLYDFFKVKGNMYVYTGTLISLVSEFYTNLKLLKEGKKLISYFLNPKKFKASLELFSFGLDMAFGYVTLDKAREVLAKATVTNESYVVPQDSVVLREIRRALGLGLKEMVLGAMRKSINIATKLTDKKSVYGLEDVNELRYTPIFQGVMNHIETLLATAQEWDSQDSISIQEVADKMVQVDIDRIFSKDRNKIQSLVKIAEISRKGLNALAKEDDIMYGSSTVESTYDEVFSLHKNIKTTMDATIWELKQIQAGKAPKPTPPDAVDP